MNYGGIKDKKKGGVKLKGKNHIYYWLRIECDECGNYNDVRQNLPKGRFGNTRCRHCRSDIGILQWEILDKVKETSEERAYQKFKEREKAGIQDKPKYSLKDFVLMSNEERKKIIEGGIENVN